MSLPISSESVVVGCAVAASTRLALVVNSESDVVAQLPRCLMLSLPLGGLPWVHAGLLLRPCGGCVRLELVGWRWTSGGLLAVDHPPPPGNFEGCCCCWGCRCYCRCCCRCCWSCSCSCSWSILFDAAACWWCGGDEMMKKHVEPTNDCWLWCRCPAVVPPRWSP